MAENTTDISRNDILAISPDILPVLLKDHTTGRNIFWASDNYAERGDGYQFSDPISIEAITGINGNVIVPRALKSQRLQKLRSKEKAEIFTPSWLCNKQANLLDEAIFGRQNVFNTEVDNPDGSHTWIPSEGKIVFPEKMSWRKYIAQNQLEITCGEAPYLASRYDAVTGNPIPIGMRIGLLDRKMRVVDENTSTTEEWLAAAKIALHSTYGYEWQGDNIIIARGNLLFSMIEYYSAKFDDNLPIETIREYAEIISWNIWQMDGLKAVIPCSCHDEKIVKHSMFGEPDVVKNPCPGCKAKDIKRHNGIYCDIMDWEEGHPIKFVSLIKGNPYKNHKK